MKVLVVMMTVWMVSLSAYADIKKIPVEKVTSVTKGEALQTYYGTAVSLSDVLKKESVQKILKRSQIELRSGDILYPEEVEFVLVPKKRGFFSKFKGLFKAPHQDD